MESFDVKEAEIRRLRRRFPWSFNERQSFNELRHMIGGAVGSTADIRQLVAKSPMSAHQIAAIVVCVGLNMLDGFDVLVMSFTAAGVSAEWQLSGAQLGMLFSAGLVGMAVGSLFLAPRADRFGRRT